MHFADDTDDALQFVAALANTLPTASASGRDELSTAEDLDAIFEQHPYSGRIDHDEAELAEVRSARARLRRIWDLDTPEAVQEVNAMLREAGALPHLAEHDGFDWHLHATEPDAPLAERIRVEASMAFIDVIRSGETSRLRVCEAPHCDGVLVDLTRNGSKRYCSLRCGNRVAVSAFRERRSDARG